MGASSDLGQSFRPRPKQKLGFGLGVEYRLSRYDIRGVGRKEMFYLTTHSTHFIYGKGPHIQGERKPAAATWGRKEMFYLTTHSTHFIYGYMASDIW